MNNIEKLRAELTEDQVKEILAEYDFYAVTENAQYIQFPSYCHNPIGSVTNNNLFYYKDTKLFFCFSECGELGDIFNLLIRIYENQGKELTLRQAIGLCHLDPDMMQDDIDISKDTMAELRYFYERKQKRASLQMELPVYDDKVMKNFSPNLLAVNPWLKEGISQEALDKFSVVYEPDKNIVVIPNYNITGHLIGLRGRFYNTWDIQKGKYRPLTVKGKLYNYPTGQTLYGLYENQEAIRKHKTAILFEGEKSVLLYETLFEDNIALATFGKNISNEHIKWLSILGVSKVILAYDTDYATVEEYHEKSKEYYNKGRILSNFFTVEYLMDDGFILPHKSSPIDGGKEKFLEISKNAIRVR